MLVSKGWLQSEITVQTLYGKKQTRGTGRVMDTEFSVDTIRTL